MKRITQVTVLYEDETTETIVGRGTLTRGSTYQGTVVPKDDPKDPHWIHMVAINMVEPK